VIWEGRSRRTVFILGAGATRGAVHHVRIHGRKISAPLNSDFFKVARAYAKAQETAGKNAFQERYERIKRVFQEEFSTRGRWPLPMEEAFSLLFVSKDFPEIYGQHGRPRGPGSRKEIEDFLRLTFGILTAIESEVPVNNLYSRLVSKLEPSDTLVTLNYDTLLDSALVRAGWNPKKGYGLMGGGNKISWNGKRDGLAPQLADVKLLKLHGSLNWYVRGSFEKLAQIFEKKPSRVLVSTQPRTNEFGKYVRQIIPPVYGKFFGHRHWRTLWRGAHEAILGAEVVVVIGCSLVSTDFHLTGMLGNAIKRRKDSGRPFALAVAVDTTKIRHKWFKLLKGCTKLRNSYPSFEVFANYHLTNKI
jgi:SIR2-like domain